MNVIFAFLFILAALSSLLSDPTQFLSSLVDGAGKSATLCIALLGTYAVWLGLMKVWEDSGVADGASRLLKPLSRKLFKTNDEPTLTAISMNLSANLLGLSGASTPYGVKAAQLLDKNEHAEYASAMLFVLNATSIQLIPTSIIGLRTALKSGAPADIVLPTLLTTVFSTLLGVVLTFLFLSPNHRKAGRVFFKKQGAGLQ